MYVDWDLPICYHIRTRYYICILSEWNKLSLRDLYIPRIGEPMVMCGMMHYYHTFLFSLKCIFQLYSLVFPVSWHGYRYIAILCIGQLHPITVYRTVFGCALSWCGVSLCVPFTNSLVEGHYYRDFYGHSIHWTTVLGFFGLTTCLLHVGALFWKSRLKWYWVCKCDIVENNFFIVLIMFTYNALFFT